MELERIYVLEGCLQVSHVSVGSHRACAIWEALRWAQCMKGQVKAALKAAQPAGFHNGIQVLDVTSQTVLIQELE
jgi:hypothetical protein